MSLGNICPRHFGNDAKTTGGKVTYAWRHNGWNEDRDAWWQGTCRTVTLRYARQAVPESTIRIPCVPEHVYFIVIDVPSWRFMFSVLVVFVDPDFAKS
ncbi:hypothetical protein [Novacetimonas maltaceti]|uniref:hypothetical protein n=1 Tax=Novacetimonas maltaceti TaxID=1203393 RepID=UPI0011B5A42E|nr:hypothetical protein [Novacetimonas maltaceti]